MENSPSEEDSVKNVKSQKKSSQTNLLLNRIKNELSSSEYEEQLKEKTENDDSIIDLIYGLQCLKCDKKNSVKGNITQVRSKKSILTFFSSDNKIEEMDLQNVIKIDFPERNAYVPEKYQNEFQSKPVTFSGNQNNFTFAFKTQKDFFNFLNGILLIYGSHIEDDCSERRIWNQLGGDKKGYLNEKAFEKFCKIMLKEKHWKELFDLYDKDHSGSISYDEFSPFLKKFLGGEEYSEIFNKYSKGQKFLNFPNTKEFFEEYQKENLSNEEIAIIMSDVKYKPSEEGKKKKEELQKKITEFFKEDNQKEIKEEDPLFSELMINLKDFKRLIEARLCSIYDKNKIHNKVEDYRPMNDFYINSSHNTYLTGHQLYGDSSEVMYKLAMDLGCRLVELDCYDGSGEDIIITHGYTLAGKVKLVKILKMLKESAFISSEYPVILSIENHLSNKYQQIMARDIKEILQCCYILDVDKPPKDLEPLEKMKRNFIIKCGGARPKVEQRDAFSYRAQQPYTKPSAAILLGQKNTCKALMAFGMNAIKTSVLSKEELNPSSDEKSKGEAYQKFSSLYSTIFKSDGTIKESEDPNTVNNSPTKLRGGKKKKPEEEMTELEKKDENEYLDCLLDVRGLVGVKYNYDKIETDNYQNYEFVTLKDPMFKKICESYEKREKVSKFSTVTFMKAYPQKLNSINYDPIKVWLVGGHVAALNIQSLNEDYSLINKVFFMQNEGCGYVLKPKKLLPESLYIEKYESYHALKIRLFNICEMSELVKKAGKELEKKAEMKLIFKVYGSCQDDKTEEVEIKITGNFMKPEFEKTKFSFPIFEKELGCIVIRFEYNGNIIGRSAVPLCMMSKGIRRIPLFDTQQIEALNSSIIAEFTPEFEIKY
ncbi:MAG: phosphatidylinositol-specific phospholipase C domain-containing protein [archaeon]|nr:phosphatidylinositol-specific phospholipase C domain-containing protein [archaeon]